jgi:HK97 family phage portal protein
MRWLTPPQSLVGVSPLIQTRNLTGIALAMDRHLAQWYAEGGTPSSVLETDEKLTNEQAQILRNTWLATHRKHRLPAVLSNGMKWKPITSSAADMELILTREQLIRDIARVYRIPANLIGAMSDGQTYQNVEQASLNFLTHTIAPWLRRIEIALSQILPPGQDVAFDTSSLLRTDALTRSRVYAMDIQAGTMSPNEARQLQGREPYVGGDVFNQALAGSVTAGGEVAPLGVDSDKSLPIMGVVE